MISAIAQIRQYASNYAGKRQAFFESLFAMADQPIPEGQGYDSRVSDLYKALVGALLFEVVPPTKESYHQVLGRLNQAIEGEALGPIHLATYAESDRPYDLDSRLPQEFEQSQEPIRRWSLEETLPAGRKLTIKKQATVDRFLEEIEDIGPFSKRQADRG